MNLAIGQRWLYSRFDSGYNDVWVCEITGIIDNNAQFRRAAVKILQIKRGLLFKVGQTFPCEDLNRLVYSLLEGQDAP